MAYRTKLAVATAALPTLLFFIGCGDPPPTDGNVPGLDSGVDSGPTGCTDDSDCGDGVDCTEDTCNPSTGSCRHSIVPALCPAGASCHPVRGCEMGNPCADDTDCEDEDACTVNERCDPATRVCVVDPLDGDGDGDPPRVCGGGDCDDSNADVFGGASERCNGTDDDCDGSVDEATDMEMCGAMRICSDGRCTCMTGLRACDGSCVDSMTSDEHCGSCGNSCGSDASCVSGVCTCTGGRAFCTDVCVDTQTDDSNCGMCGRACPSDMSCSGGMCVCSGGLTNCDGACVDTSSDMRNCGSCGHICEGGMCDAGSCVWTSCPDPFTTCSGMSTCTFYDPSNCGACGVTCPPGSPCGRGTCL